MFIVLNKQAMSPLQVRALADPFVHELLNVSSDPIYRVLNEEPISPLASNFAITRFDPNISHEFRRGLVVNNQVADGLALQSHVADALRNGHVKQRQHDIDLRIEVCTAQGVGDRVGREATDADPAIGVAAR